VLTLTPTLLDQELDTTASIGQIYWEGQVTIVGRRGGQAAGGLGYVELTDYADRTGTPAVGV
jgi:predicted secreted hydrolase